MDQLAAVVANIVGEFRALAWTYPIAVALEMLWPRDAYGPFQRLKGATFTVLYLTITGAAITGQQWLLGALHIKPLLTLGLHPSNWLANGAVLVMTPVLTVMTTDLFQYWFHRLQHTWAPLWRLHAVHHSIRDLNALNGAHHWTEEIIRIPLMILPMALLIHFDMTGSAIVSALIVLQVGYLHSRTRLHFGPLVRVLADNRMHRIHHSIEERHIGRNFGVFTTLWDQLFGTAYFPALGEWPQTGIAEQPETGDLTDYLFGPFLPLGKSRRDATSPT